MLISVSKRGNINMIFERRVLNKIAKCLSWDPYCDADKETTKIILPALEFSVDLLLGG